MNIIAVVQARLGSSRLPMKVVEPVYRESSILDIVLEKVTSVVGKNRTVLATTREREDNLIAEIGEAAGVSVIRGSTDDVLSRFQTGVQETGADGCLRICADNPLLLRDDLTRLIEIWKANPVDYLSFGIGGIPTIRRHQGLWGEMIGGEALLELNGFPLEKSDREHVTQYLYQNPGRFEVRIEPYQELPEVLINARLTVDTRFDLDNVRRLIKILGVSDPSITDIEQALLDNPDLQQSMAGEIRQNIK